MVHGTGGGARSNAPHPDLFPPALVPLLRERFGDPSGCVRGLSDEDLGHLLSSVFFASMETHESERNPVRVVLLGDCTPELVLPQEPNAGTLYPYRWKLLRFASPRPVVVPELVKLAVMRVGERMYTAVRAAPGGGLVICGLAREGSNPDPAADPFLKIVASRAGRLSIRSGPDRFVEYEAGAILAAGENVLRSSGPLGRALEAAGRAAKLEDPVLPDYVDAIRALVGQMASHGRGGLLVIDSQAGARLAGPVPYQVVVDTSVAALLRLARLIASPRDRAVDPAGLATGASGSRSGNAAFADLLRSGLRSETERIVEELGALTAIDGATLLDFDLMPLAFGVILPVEHEVPVVEALDAGGARRRPLDLGSRGTRHRAGATYAGRHAGSLVFVASEDGQVSCMHRGPSDPLVTIWRLGPGDVPGA